METELRNQLLATTSALQVVVGLLAKQAKASNPNFVAEAEALLIQATPNGDPATIAATRAAMQVLLSA